MTTETCWPWGTGKWPEKSEFRPVQLEDVLGIFSIPCIAKQNHGTEWIEGFVVGAHRKGINKEDPWQWLVTVGDDKHRYIYDLCMIKEQS